MSSAKITLIGMYKYDNTLFDSMVLPEGIDKNLLIGTIMQHGSEFEVLYPEPDFMKQYIAIWSNKWYRTFSEWLRGTQATWNPIHNYDRYEEGRDEDRKKFDSKTTADYTDSRTANLQDKRTADLEEKRVPDLEEKRTADLTDERTADLTDETTFDNTDTTNQTVSGTTQHDVSAYDSTGYVPSSKDTINNGTSEVAHTGTVTNTQTGTDTMAHTGTDTTTTTGTDTTTTTGTDTIDHTGTDKTNRKGTLSDVGGSEQNTNMHSAHIYGNIGVTQSSDMLRSFYDISKWNLYEHISDLFVGELLIPVY